MLEVRGGMGIEVPNPWFGYRTSVGGCYILGMLLLYI